MRSQPEIAFCCVENYCLQIGSTFVTYCFLFRFPPKTEIPLALSPFRYNVTTSVLVWGLFEMPPSENGCNRERNKTHWVCIPQPRGSKASPLPATQCVGESLFKQRHHQRKESLPSRHHTITSSIIRSPFGPTFAVENVKFPRRRSPPYSNFGELRLFLASRHSSRP